MSLVEDLLYATIAALADVHTDVEPTEALLIATREMLTAITQGGGVMTSDRMLAMARVVASSRDLQQLASAARRQVLAQGLAERFGVDPHNQRVQRAITRWSAIAAGLYIGRQYMPAGYDPLHDDQLPERIGSRLAETFDQVMGQAPSQESLARRRP